MPERQSRHPDNELIAEMTGIHAHLFHYFRNLTGIESRAYHYVTKSHGIAIFI